MTTQFWTNDPSILFNKDYIFELWPTTNMCYEEKLNAITRLVILLTILGYVLTMSQRILVVGILTLVIIFVLFKMRKQKLTKEMLHEGFDIKPRISLIQGNEPSSQSDSYINPVTLDAVLKTEFKEGNRKNPFSNVLLTQIADQPNRKSAPPSFNVDVDENITRDVKKMVQMLNPGIKNTNKQLYGDLWQNFELDQSDRVFYSTPNTRVEPGDQSSYARFLYGTMPSGKDSTPDGAFARVQDSYRYTLY
jgi:hypothetical protein